MPLFLSLMGPPDIRVDGAPIQVDTRKATAILAYLAVEGGAHPRDRLVDLLWPETDVERARSSLRRTLSTLRSALGGRWLETDRSLVRLDRADVALDLDALDGVTRPRHGHGGSDTCQRCLPELEQMVELHRGGFLDGFVVRGAAPFEGWMLTQAERIRQRLDAAYAQIATAHASTGAYDLACRATEKRISLDPLREEAYRQLMLYHAWSGDRGPAIDTYRSLVTVLDTELGVPPLEETTEFYEAILEEDLPRAPAPARRVAPPPAAPERAPLVGRDVEFATAIEALSEPGGIVLIEGSPGMGVTRLLDELASSLTGRTVLRSTGSETGSSVPYGVIQELLSGVLDHVSLESLPVAVRSEASRLVPAFAPGAPPPPEPSGKARFLDALVQVATAPGHPVVVVDDVELCDTASAESIGFMVARARRSGMSVVLGLTSRDRHLDQAVDRLVQDVRRSGTVIRLEPLARDAVHDLARSLGASEGANDLLEATAGIPLFVIEALRSTDHAGVPGEVRRILGQRVAGLPGAQTQVLEAIVVLDRSVDPRIVGAVSGRSLEETDESLDALVAQGLVREDDNGSVAGAHHFITTVVRDGMTAARRRVLHRRAAQVLEASQVTEPAVIAHHYELAGNDPEAATWLVRAGDAAAAVFAHDEAVAHFEAALATEHVDRAAVHGSIGRSAMLAGDYRRAIDAFEASLAGGHPDEPAIEYRLGEIHRRLRRWDLAVAHYRRAADAAPDDETRAIATADLAYASARRGDDATELVRQALDLARSCGSHTALARAENVAGLLAADPSERRHHLERALEHASDTAERVAVLNNLAPVSSRERAVDLAQEAVGLAVQLGDRHLFAALKNTLADALQAAGRREEALATLTEAVGLFSEITTDEDEAWSPEVWFLSEW
jgi:DNA-binding SARP family transcriptional activator